MNTNNIKLDDVAEVLSYVISQEMVMAVPPVLIPTDGATIPRKRPRKEPRNINYDKKDPREAQSVSTPGSDMIPAGDEFPIEGDDYDSPECIESQVVFADDGGDQVINAEVITTDELLTQSPAEKFQTVDIYDEMEKII